MQNQDIIVIKSSYAKENLGRSIVLIEILYVATKWQCQIYSRPPPYQKHCGNGSASILHNENHIRVPNQIVYTSVYQGALLLK